MPYSPAYGSVPNTPFFPAFPPVLPPSLVPSIPPSLAGSHCHPRTDHIHQNSLHKHAQRSVGGVCFTPLFALFPLECWSVSNSAYSGSDQTAFPPPRKTHTSIQTRARRGSTSSLAALLPGRSKNGACRPQPAPNQQECLATSWPNAFKMTLTVIRKSPHFSSHLKFLLLFYSEEVHSESLGEKLQPAAPRSVPTPAPCLQRPEEAPLVSCR